METPALDLLVGAYFHEDYIAESGDMWGTVDAFLEGEPDLAPTLVRDIETTLREFANDATLVQRLSSAGCRFDTSRYPGGPRAWLAAIATHATTRLSAGA